MSIVLGILVVAVIHAVALVLRLGVLFAPVQALVAFAYWRMTRPEDRGSNGHRAVVGITAGGTILGTVLALGGGAVGAGGWAWVAIPLATILASAMFSLAFSGGGKACQLCKLPAPDKAGFNCPRCQDRVCARPTCWNAKYIRCVRCHEREIVILPTAEGWWRQRVGARVKNGECNHCYKEAHEADLRECGQCHWPMCQRCWDHHNGVCQRCKWVIPDLPPALAAFMAGVSGSGARGARGGASAPPPPSARPAGPARVSNPPPVAQPGAPPRRGDPRAPRPGGREEAAASAPAAPRPRRNEPPAH